MIHRNALLVTLIVTSSAVLAGCAAPKEASDTSTSAVSSQTTGASTPASGSTTSSSAPSGPSLGAPVLTVGDKWTERVVTTGPYGSDVTVSREVKAVETLNGHETYKIVTDTGSTVWIRTSDHASVKVHAESSGVTSDTVYDPPCVGYEWPISVGKTWTSSCSYTVTTTSSYGTTGPTPSTKSTEWTVAAIESVTVEAGTFEAYKVTFTETAGSATTTGTNWYSGKACTPVKTDQTSSGTQSTLTVKSYTCAKGA